MRLLAFSSVMVTLVDGARAAQNLVFNPGFEAYNSNAYPHEFAGWTDPQSVYFNEANFYPPHSGTSAATTGIVGQTAPLFQNITLRAGTYKLTFYADARGAGNGTILQASLGGKQLLNLVGATNQYEFYSFNYTQSRRGVATLEFDARNDPDFTSIDDVTLKFLSPLSRPVDFRQIATTQNERAVAYALYNATKLVSGQRGSLYEALNRAQTPTASALLNGLSGEGITAAQNVAYRSAQMFNDAIFDQTTFYGSANTGNSITLTAPQLGFSTLAPDQTLAASGKGLPIRELADLPAAHIEPTFVAPTRTWRAWASGFGGVEDIHGNAGVGSAYQQNTIYGGALGVDYQLLPNYLLGVAVGGSDGNFSVPGLATSGSTSGGHVAFYDLATFGAFYGASSTSFSYFTNRSTRYVSGFGGLASETERGDFNSDEFRSRLEFGRHFGGFGGVLTPFIALEIAELRSNGFGETSVTGPGLFRLNVQGQSAASVPSYVGARLQETMVLGNGMVLTPTVQAAWVHEFAPYRSQIGSIADLPGATFLVDGAQPARNAAQIKAGAELGIGARTAIFANFDGELSGVNQLYAGKGGLRIAW